jgi:hypothetical protein
MLYPIELGLRGRISAWRHGLDDFRRHSFAGLTIMPQSVAEDKPWQR